MKKPCYGILECEIIDSSDLKRMPARVSILDKDGNSQAPECSLFYGYALPDEWPSDWGAKGDQKYFYCDGSFSIKLPCGKAEIKVFRGYEYAPSNIQIIIKPEGAKLKLKLERIIDMPEHGWRCGDNHTHLDHYPLHYDVKEKDGLLITAAEGLNHVCFLRNKIRKPHTKRNSINIHKILSHIPTPTLSGLARRLLILA